MTIQFGLEAWAEWDRGDVECTPYDYSLFVFAILHGSDGWEIVVHQSSELYCF